MSHRSAPDWLAEMQSHFGNVVRTPLDRSTGTLRATTDAYDPLAVAEALDGPHTTARDRLAVYNRQYWFRLFTVMQTAFPLTSRLLGAWTFNGLASRFLLAHPPHHWDLDHAPDGFETWLSDALNDGDPREVLLDAAALDTSWRKLFRAPATQPFHPTAEDAARILDARLVPSPAVALIRERHGLFELKRSLATLPRDAVLAPPAKLATPRWWALVREPGGIRHLPVEPREGELLAMLTRSTVRDALAELEANCDETERATLPANTRRWLARSVERGFWTGLSAG